MGILLERSLCIASDDFVDKLENDSVSEYIDFAMEQCIKHLKMNSNPGKLWFKIKCKKYIVNLT